MIEASVEDTPLTIVWKRLAEEDAVLDVMTDVVPTDPPMFEERVLVATERELVVERLVIVAFVAVRLVITDVTALNIVAKRFDEVVVANVVDPENVLLPAMV